MNDCDTLNDGKYGIVAINAWNVQTFKLAVPVIIYINPLVRY